MCRASTVRHVITSVKCFKPSLGIISKRSFFTEKELGVDDLRQNRLKVRLRIEKQSEDIDVHKLNLIQSFPNSPVKEKAHQLYDYILLMDSTDEDLNTLKSILVQYQSDAIAAATTTATATTSDNTSNAQGGVEFHVGTAIMRIFCLLNFPDAAIEVIKNCCFSKQNNKTHPFSWFDLQFYQDEQMQSLFDEMSAYKVLLTLLHNNKRFEEIFKLYNEFRARVELQNRLPHASINVIAFSACYHLVKFNGKTLATRKKKQNLISQFFLQNTPEHYKYAKDLYPHVRHIKAFKRRTKYLLAGLALKQNDPMFALQLLDDKEFQIGARFIRLIAFTQCNSFDSALAVLNQTIDVYKQGKMLNVPYYGKQVVIYVRCIPHT